MEREEVDSSNIISIGYEEETETLEVEFHGGRVYQYYGVPNHIHRDLMSADSHGGFLDSHVKKAGYTYKEV